MTPTPTVEDLCIEAAMALEDGDETAAIQASKQVLEALQSGARSEDGLILLAESILSSPIPMPGWLLTIAHSWAVRGAA